MSKIVQDPLSYFRELIPERGRLLRELEKEAEREKIPIVGPVVGELLYVLARAVGARRILELGTASGYSTLYLAEACRESDGKVVTLELSPDMAARACHNVETAGLKPFVDVRVGDALKTISGMEAPFDVIFIDIEKKDYLRALPHCERLLHKGGLLLADNVAFEDADGYNRAISASSAWRAVSLFSFLPAHSPENDGFCFALRV